MTSPSATPAGRAPVASPDQRWLLAAVAAGVFIAADDQTSIVALLAPIINDLGITVDDFYRSSWVINGYLLGYIVALPILGRVADVYGRRRVFAAALGVFMVGSAAVALAPTFETLSPLVRCRRSAVVASCRWRSRSSSMSCHRGVVCSASAPSPLRPRRAR